MLQVGIDVTRELRIADAVAQIAPDVVDIDGSILRVVYVIIGSWLSSDTATASGPKRLKLHFGHVTI